MQKILLITLTFLIGFPLLSSSQDFNQFDDQGRKQGKWRKTYSNGVIKYEGQFRNDQPYGEFKYYYESANIQAVTHFSTDGIIARTITYHENGKQMAEGKYINQNRDSTWNFYSELDGSLVMKEDFKKGKLDGKSILYYPGKDQVAEITTYKMDVKEGPFIKYFPDGKVMAEGTYTNDQLDGNYVVYYDNGNIKIKGNYSDGIQAGKWQYFDENSIPITEEEYKKQNNIKQENR